MKTASITGGTGGIGTALSLKLIEHGYFVISTHNNKSSSFLKEWKNTHKLNSDKIKFINCDITDYSQARISIEELVEEMNIDLLINNAGITRDSSFLKMNFHQWHDVINTNMTANIPSHILDQIKNDIPTKELVKPYEIGNTVMYIIDDMPSLTGCILSVNGGQYMQ